MHNFIIQVSLLLLKMLELKWELIHKRDAFILLFKDLFYYRKVPFNPNYLNTNLRNGLDIDLYALSTISKCYLAI